MEAARLEEFLFYFFLYSFIGWIFETLYKTVRTGRFMNSGFLYGPFVPIYGFSAIITLSAETFLASFVPLGGRLGLYMMTATVLEYYTGTMYEQVFGVRLWDYSNKPFNLKGRICLQYSLYWLLLNALLLTLMQPLLMRTVSHVPISILAVINRILLLGILVDFIFACRNLQGIVQFFNTLNKDYLYITKEIFQKSIDSFQRLLGTFPNLKTYITSNIRNNLLRDFNSSVKDILGKGLMHESNGAAIMRNGNVTEMEFREIVDDILQNEAFLRLRDFHHHNSSIFDHVKSVAYLTYRFCRQRKLDYKSATRGALLHDFFLYDWRSGNDENGVHHKGHIYLHPKMALQNAENNFRINDMERDIIINHMWPLSPSMPKYKETFIVSFIDKYIATWEFFEMLKQFPGKMMASTTTKKENSRDKDAE